MSAYIEKYYKISLIAFCGLLALQMWLCSGNLAPYAATLANPHIISPEGDLYEREDTSWKKRCYYIANFDHPMYLANYSLLQGATGDELGWTQLFRRPLIFMISYPFMKMFGFLSGGFLIAVIVNVSVFAWFCLWVRKRWGTAAFLAALLLLGAYPATMYWGGLPYPHSLITSCTLLLTVLLYKTAETGSLKKIAMYSLLAGISFLGYDTYGFFIPAFVFLLLWQKKWKALPLALLLMLLPLVLWLWYLRSKSIGLSGVNSEIYTNMFNSYRNMNATELWNNFRALPALFYGIVNAATYGFIALFFLLVMLTGLFTRSLKKQHPAFIMIAVSVLLLYLVTNMAPAYAGWQIRGLWIARIYQPAVVLLLLPVFSIMQQLELQNRKILLNGVLVLALVVFLMNIRINAGPVFGDYSQADFHYRFYTHSEDAIKANLDKFGRRPLWVCP